MSYWDTFLQQNNLSQIAADPDQAGMQTWGRINPETGMFSRLSGNTEEDLIRTLQAGQYGGLTDPVTGRRYLGVGGSDPLLALIKAGDPGQGLEALNSGPLAEIPRSILDSYVSQLQYNPQYDDWSADPELNQQFSNRLFSTPYWSNLLANSNANSGIGKFFEMMPITLGAAFGGAALGGGFAGLGESAVAGGGTGAFDAGLFSASDVGLGATNAFGLPWESATNMAGFQSGNPMSFFEDFFDFDPNIPSYDPFEFNFSNDYGQLPEILGGTGSGGAPYQSGYNFWDPSSYSGDFGQSFLDSLNKLKTPSLPGGDSGGSGSSLLSKLLGGGSGGGLLSSLLSAGPGLGALAYARNQDPFDTSRLENIYNQAAPGGLGGGLDLSNLQSAYNSIDPNSLAMPYDIQSGKGRESLTSSLTNRGVMGSSFANQDLAGYDTMRQLGRQNLLSSGATAQAGIANQMLQAQLAQRGQGLQSQTLQGAMAKQIMDAQIAQQKNKNDLYGRALLALSGGLGGKQTSTLGSSLADFFR